MCSSDLTTANVFEVDRSYRFKKGSGMPISIPVIEMVEIGAGGGSIATVDNMSQIRVGPHSAGSEPGPACYQRGGVRPTVTDADLLLADSIRTTSPAAPSCWTRRPRLRHLSPTSGRT